MSQGKVTQIPAIRSISQRRLKRFLQLQKLLEKMLANAQELIEIAQSWEEAMASEIEAGAPIEPGEIKAHVSGHKLILG